MPSFESIGSPFRVKSCIGFSLKPLARSPPPNGTPSGHASSPIEPLHPFDQVEMPVSAQDGKVMLSTQRRNPGVVGRNRCASLFNSIVSNSRLIRVLIRAVSLRKCRRLPANFILAFCRAGDLASSLSATASLTNWRRGILCSAAFALARRKMASGISNVVFMV